MSSNPEALVPTKAVYLMVVPGFADWEPAHALAQLRRHGGYRVEVVGLGSALVESMGGLRVQPSRVLADVDPADVAVFILPGGDRWESAPLEPELATLLGQLDAAGVPLAAICAATVAIARTSLLRGRRHTSNGRAYLEQHVPGYDGGAEYVEAPAVRDRGLITASGLAAVEFAAELFKELDVLSEADRIVWTDLFRGGRIPRGGT
jgi:putative intracellular protease/amidase